MDNPLSLLSAMITPAVLISACGTLIMSTSMRLARIVDRVRDLSQQVEQLFLGEITDFTEERRAEVERQLSVHARRGKIIQNALTGFYISLGLLVAATVSIGLTALSQIAAWLPAALGIAGTISLFYGSILLIAETRLALRSVNSEMQFTLHLRDLYRQRSEDNNLP
jgi:Protein of unknown function (DUF2721)